MNLTALIIDDEPASRNILKKYLQDIPGVTLVAECRDAFEASEFLSQKNVDLLFLDINMPRLSGISFAKTLTQAPMIIFITAYPEYAVEGFDMNAVDYLVKPFSFERFLKAVNKAIEKSTSGNDGHQRDNTLLVRADKKIYALKTNDIIYIESCGDYVKIVTGECRSLIVHDTMKGFFDRLPGNEFMRVHRSYTVNISHVHCIEGNMIQTPSDAIPVSPAYRQELLDRL
ncbi:MAG: LytTR family DNA-binding domain-containing protein [Bacteroidales bacterium]|nr:LytTR family DNA-binding domain-containing protein [Bacteroidales bacterium]